MQQETSRDNGKHKSNVVTKIKKKRRVDEKQLDSQVFFQN